MSFAKISRWFVGSSKIITLLGDNNKPHKANLAFSPPESTFIFLYTASPENKKAPNKGAFLFKSITLKLFN